MAQVTGRVQIKVDGNELLNKSGWTLNVGGVNRNPMNGDGGVHGYAEETVEPRTTGNVSHTEAMDLVEAAKTDNATILFTTDTGQGYVLREAWITEPPELTAGEGQVSLNYAAMSCERS